MFDYREFYYNILGHIGTALTDDERTDILAWYQK
jgi:hypothetical protein